MQVKIKNVKCALRDNGEPLLRLKDILDIYNIHNGDKRRKLKDFIIDEFKSIYVLETYDNGSWNNYGYITLEQFKFLLEAINKAI